jgi:hypothetical protein
MEEWVVTLGVEAEKLGSQSQSVSTLRDRVHLFTAPMYLSTKYDCSTTNIQEFEPRTTFARHPFISTVTTVHPRENLDVRGVEVQEGCRFQRRTKHCFSVSRPLISILE